MKVVDDEKDCVFNVPKLVVGLSLAKKYAERNGFEFDILEHMFPDGNMWTFKNTEKGKYMRKISKNSRIT